MKILLWHGYLLSGSGSNIYTANLARMWRAAGHDVLLMCQEKAPEHLGFIDEVADMDESNRSFSPTETGVASATGRCILVRPAIGSILPVYVFDEYEHFTAKRFVDLSDDELAAYTDANVVALTTALDRFAPDVIIAGHEVMGPYIARRACGSRLGYTAKLHGSALEYAVKKQERYLRFASEGLGGADVVVGGSRYMVDEAASVIPGWAHKAVVINPGCDTDVFKPRARSHGPPTIGFIGKLIAQKGVQRLLAALTSVRTRPLKAVIVGYGGDEVVLRELADALVERDLARSREVAGGLGDEETTRWLEGLPTDGLDALKDVTIVFTGRLEHGPLAELLPSFDVLAAPSILPEAFGMIAAEAAASGVLPVVPDHSGIAEAGGAIEAALGRPGLLTFSHQEDPIRSLAAALDRVLSLDPAERRELGAKAVTLARSRWSWEEVSRALLKAASPR
jgi:glycosyltransferase involved in cell wall biosynthesis